MKTKNHNNQARKIPTIHRILQYSWRVFISCMRNPRDSLLLVGVGVLLLCFVAWRHFHPGLAQVSAHTSLQFPPNAKLMGSSYVRWQGFSLRATVELDHADVESFLASVPRPCEVAKEDRSFLTFGFEDTQHMPSWWNPYAAQKFIAANYQWHSPDGSRNEKDHHWEVLELLIDLDNPQRAVIYLDWGGQ